MKKKCWVLSLLCLIFVFAGLTACGDEPVKKGSIVGAPEVVILKASDTTYDFTQGVTGTLDGEAAEVTADSSAVEFGVPGEYEVVYTLGDATVTTKVRIYGTPVITAADAEQKYADAIQWTVGVTAKDTFGTELELLTTPPADYHDGDLLEYGAEYEVSYTAMDAAGNTATKTRKITVTEEDRPVFEDEMLDLSAFDATVGFDTAGFVKALDEEGEEITGLFTESTEGVLSWNPEYFAAAGTKEYTFTIVTETGYNTLKVSVQTGDAIDALTLSGDITDYVFETGLTPAFPTVVIGGGNVNQYTILYEVAEFGSSDYISIEDFQPESGDYTFRIRAKLVSSQGEPATIAAQNFKLREGAKLIDYSLTDQNMDFFIAPTNVGAKLVFVEEVTIGEETSSAYRFTSGTGHTAAMDYVLQFNQEMLAERIEAGLTTVSFEVAIKELTGGITGADTQWYAQPGIAEGYPEFAASNLANIASAVGNWMTYTIDLSVPFTSNNLPVYELDASGQVNFTFGGFGLYMAFYSTPNPKDYKVGPQEVYLRNVRFGHESDTSAVQNTYGSDDGRTVTLGAGGAAEVDGQDYTYELYQDNTVLFFDAATPISAFAMTFVPAGGQYGNAALIMEDGTVCVGRLVYEDGDILALSAEGSVSFELPDFAADLASMENFKYELRKYGEDSVLDGASAGSSYTFTSAGLYEWTASFGSGADADSYTYNIYVCEADDPFGKVTTTDKDGISKGSFRFDRMDDTGKPVFVLSGAEMYLDGDYVEQLLASAAAQDSKYQLWIYEVPAPEGSTLNGQCYITWDGQNTSTAGGCYANPSRDSYAMFPGNLAAAGIERAGEEDFRIYYPAGGPREITSIEFRLIVMTGEINGTKDIYLTTEAESYDFLSGVTGTLDGAPATVKVDSSQVQFGTEGTYDVVYTLGTATVTIQVHITDDPLELLTVGDISNYIFPVTDAPVDFPKVTEPGGYEYEYEYRVYRGEEDLGDADSFIASAAGDYVYVIRARIKGDSSWTEIARQPFYLREGSTEVYDPAISDQNMDFFIANTGKGADLAFVEEVTIGGSSSSAYIHYIAPYNENGWSELDQMLEFDAEKLEEMIAKGFTTLTFDVGVGSYGSPDSSSDVVWMNAEFYGINPNEGSNASNTWGQVAATTGGILFENQWATITLDLAAGFTSPSTPTIYTIDPETQEVILTFRNFGIRFLAYSQYGAGIEQILWDQSQPVYIRNVRFGQVSDTAAAQNTYTGGSGTVVLGASGAATVNEAPYTYELYQDGTLLFFEESSRVFAFEAKYVAAGGEYGNAAIVMGEDVYLGELQFEDGDILALSAEGNVSFELPDFAADLSSSENFKYELKKVGGSDVLTTAAGSYTFTEAGAYEWVASFTSGAENKSYAYQLYVCTADDPTGKLYFKEGAGTLRFVRMDGLTPVFEAKSTEASAMLYLDGDYVSGKLAEGEAAQKSHSLVMDLTPISGELYINWEGQEVAMMDGVPKPGCRGTFQADGEWVTVVACSPAMLAYTGEAAPGFPAYERQGDEDFYLWFNGAASFEFKDFNFAYPA